MKYSIPIAVFLIASFLAVGCRETNPRRSRNSHAEAQKQFEQELEAKMAMSDQYLAPYRTNGYVIFKTEPNDASLYINDGEIGIAGASHILIPAGTYRIKAVWPDGSSVEKNVFVLPALQEPPSYSWNFERDAGGEKTNIKFNAPLHKTEIALNKPK